MREHTLFLIVCILILGLLTICCSENSQNKTDLNSGKEGFGCREDAPKCDEGLECDEMNICKKIDAEEICESKGMVLIPKGEFMMGFLDGDDNEKPVHKVTLTKDICMDKYEYKNKNKEDLKAKHPQLDAEGKDYDSNTKVYQWADIVDYGKILSGGEVFGEAERPLVGVNWYIVKRICELEGKRLPTEAEWEYAARGGIMNYTECKYGTEDCVDPSKDNSCWSCLEEACKKESTCVVGSYRVNKFGLYDMSGNVYEWTGDWFNNYTLEDQTDPHGPENGTVKILRGGAWNSSNNEYLRTVYRSYSYPYDRSHNLGFRCVVELED